MTRVFLIGYMGAGKTTIGRVLAHELNIDFYDLDWYIEDRFRKKVHEIFAERGEEGFRKMEHNMLKEVGEFEDVVISCGGGTPCFFDNMDFMNKQGETIFLDAAPEVLKEHLLMGKSQRPLIQGKNPDELEEFIQESIKDRLPYYNKAKHTIKVNVIYTREEILDYAHKVMDAIGVN